MARDVTLIPATHTTADVKHQGFFSSKRRRGSLWGIL